MAKRRRKSKDFGDDILGTVTGVTKAYVTLGVATSILGATKV